MYKTTDLKLQFLGIIPQLRDKTGLLTPEQIAALSALLTFKGKSVKELVRQTLEKGQDLDKKVRIILNKSSLRGHASIATTPVLAFNYEGSKFIDSMLTGIVFASALMASGRRTGTTPDEIVFPTKIWANRQAREIYKKQSRENINCFNWLLGQGVDKDEASKILQYGIYGTGILVLPIESIVGFAREYEIESEWMPEEAEILLKILKKNLAQWGVEQLFYTRLVAPRDIYPYPNIFKDPRVSNLVRELGKSIVGAIRGSPAIKTGGSRPAPTLDGPSVGEESVGADRCIGPEIVDCQIFPTKDLRRELKNLNLLTKKIAKDKKKILKDWPKLLALRRQIARDYNLAAELKVWSSVAWRVWGDKKRHRTVPQVVESIYYCVERAIKKLKAQSSKLKATAQNLKLNNSMKQFNPTKILDAPLGLSSRVLLRNFSGASNEAIDEIDSVFSSPPTIQRNPHYLQRYLNCAFGSLACYQKLVNLGIKPPDAVFVIPRGLRIDVLQSYNLYNLISGYYPLRLCTTVEEQLRAITAQEVLAIKKILIKKDFKELAEAISVKCQQTCFCHEEKFCGQIKAVVKDYDEEFHRRMLESLEERYKKVISK